MTCETVAGAALVQVDRAIYDLEQGWPEAALDALGRARGILHKASGMPICGESTAPRGSSPEFLHPPYARAREAAGALRERTLCAQPVGEASTSRDFPDTDHARVREGRA